MFRNETIVYKIIINSYINSSSIVFKISTQCSDNKNMLVNTLRTGNLTKVVPVGNKVV